MAASAITVPVTSNRASTIAALNAAITQIRIADSNESMSYAINSLDGGKSILLSGTSTTAGLVGTVTALAVEQASLDADPAGTIAAALAPYSLTGEAILDKVATPYNYTVFFVRPQFDGTIPSGPAGGDLTATYPNPTVAKIRNIPVSTTPPTSPLEFLHYDGVSQIEFAPIGSLPVGAVAGGDLNGFYPNPTVDGIQGFPVQAPPYTTLYDRLQWNGASWELGHNATIQLIVGVPAVNLNTVAASVVPLAIVLAPDPTVLNWVGATPTRVQILQTGYYHCSYNLAWLNGGGTRTVNSLALLNGITVLTGSIAQGRCDSAPQQSFESSQCTFLFFATAGDYLELAGRRDTSGPGGTANSSTFGSLTVWQHKRTA